MIGERINPSLFIEIEYEVESHLDQGYCDEEEEYQPIFEGEKESEESVETPHDYTAS